MKHYDLVVVGGGSGGLGAALAAARLGVQVLLIESAERLGGTAAWAGVNCWEMGAGGTGLPFDIYKRLKRIPNAVGIYSLGRHFSFQDAWYWPHQLDKVNFPGGEDLIDPDRRYADTLRRHRGPGLRVDEAFWREYWHGVPFEPASYAHVVAELLAETGNCEVRSGSALADVQCCDRRVLQVGLDDGTRVSADAWVDGSGFLAFKAGCEAHSGQDPRARYGEPSAPEAATDRVNATTLIYRISATDTPGIEPLPDDVPSACWWADHFPPMCCNQYPCGDRNVNMLPTMEGREFLNLGPPRAYRECSRRIKAHWHFVQTHWPEFRQFRMSWQAPMLGVRESHRIVADYMLTEHDLIATLAGQAHDDIITIADHARDVHGEGGHCPELDGPYGVPYRCLIPKGWRNLLVAGRCAGFSSIAASSCRLSRTMMQLGQAAGTAVALAQAARVSLPEVDRTALRECLRQQHCQLDWPLPPELAAYLIDEGS